jgi:hypothetical protein
VLHFDRNVLHRASNYEADTKPSGFYRRNLQECDSDERQSNDNTAAIVRVSLPTILSVRVSPLLRERLEPGNQIAVRRSAVSPLSVGASLLKTNEVADFAPVLGVRCIFRLADRDC